MYNLLLSTVLAFTRDDIDTIEEAVGTSNIKQLGQFFSGGFGRIGLVDLIIFIAGALFTIYLAWGGIKFMTSGGDPKGVGEAKAQITNALVGLIITITAYWIVQFIAIVLGLETVQSTF